MKRLIFKITALTLIISYTFSICFHDLSFAEEGEQNTDNSSKINSTTDISAKSEPSFSTSIASLGAGLSSLFGPSAENIYQPASLGSYQTDLFTGSATFTVPIAVPPGRAGMQPDLDLSYSSNSNNSWCGVGWDIGLSAIRRSTKKGIPHYDDTDEFTFLFGGSNLKLVNVGNSEYRIETASPLFKFYYNGSFWEGRDKNGTRYIFGSESNSRLTNSFGTVGWYLERIVDTRGNYIIFSYIQDQGQIYPSQISYTGNEQTGDSPQYTINFILEGRDDSWSSYETGSEVVTAYRLQKIEIKFQEKLLRSYLLQYIYSKHTFRSLLSSITQYGSDGISTFPPLRFAYTAHEKIQLPSKEEIWAVPATCIPLAGSFTGKGIQRGLFSPEYGGWAVFSGRVPYPFWITNFGVGKIPLLGDFNGDGLTDAGAFYSDEGKMDVAISDSTAFKDPRTWVSGLISGLKPFSGDFNGDGKTDIGGFKENTGDWQIALSDGSKFNISSSWNMNFGNGEMPITGDFNGDGLTDIGTFNKTSGKWQIALSKGNGFLLPTTWLDSFGSNLEPFTGDFNGDRRIDVGVFDKTNGNWKITFSLGNKFYVYPEYWITDFAKGQYKIPFIEDFFEAGMSTAAAFDSSSGKLEAAYYTQETISEDLLNDIFYPLGGNTHIDYQPGINSSLNATKIPFGLTVVTRIEQNDGLGNSITKIYSGYSKAYYNAEEREFWGFGYVNEEYHEGRKWYMNGYGFHQNNKFLLGKSYSLKTYYLDLDSGEGYKKYQETNYDWSYLWTHYPKAAFPVLREVNNYTYDGDATYKRTRVKNSGWDDYGNVIHTEFEGDVGLTGDEKTQVTEYTYNTTDWIVSTPKHSYLLDAQGYKVSEKWFYYDNHTNIDDPPTKGLLTKETAWEYNPLTQREARIPTTYNYDAYGNLTKVTDARNNSITTEYETELYTYPIKVTNALGHTVQSTYDYKTGQVLTSTDPNNQTTTNIYDALGRLTKVIGPNDTQYYPGVIYEYDLSIQPIRVIKEVKTDYASPPSYLTAYQFFDGLGRLIQTRSPAEADPQTGQPRQIVSDVAAFDFRGQVKEKYLPYFEEEKSQLPKGLGFLDDFEDGDYNGWIPYVGIWTLENGQLKGVGAGGETGGWIYAGDESLTNYMLEADVFFSHNSPQPKEGNAEFVLRSTGHRQNEYRIDIWRYKPIDYGNYLNGFNIIKYKNGVDVSLTGGDINYTTSYIYITDPSHIKVKIVGNLIELYINGILACSVIDPDPLTHGKFGLGVVEDWHVYFDNVKVFNVNYDPDKPKVSFQYDPLGRLIKTTNPDGTYSTISYSDWVVTTTDENNHYKTTHYDAYDRIIKIEEHNGNQTYTTTYEYDTQGNLTKVIDDKGNTTQIWYDSLGRKIKMDDPDMGTWLYEYDLVGNLKKQTDAKNQVLEFDYDALNRLTGKLAGEQTIVTYSYDDTTKSSCIGRLSKIFDQSGSTEFFYDNLGREIKSIKTVDSSQYTVVREYDSIDRLTELTYPDKSIIKYDYNPQGIEKVYSPWPEKCDVNKDGSVDVVDIQLVVNKINGIDIGNLDADVNDDGTVNIQDVQLVNNAFLGLSPVDWIKNIDYTPTGQISKIQYGNGTETNYTYEPKTLRLSNLITQSLSGKLQDLSYQFDKVGNIETLTDYVNTTTQSFLYDDLDRLIQAQGNYGSFAYTYDSIGNMTSKEGVNLIYGKAAKLPHAVTQYANTLIDYDANGNMLSKGLIPNGGLSLSYDVENRLTKVEDKSTAQPITLTLTLTPGWNFLSLPVIPSDSKISSVLSSIADKYDQVSRYNSTTKAFEHYIGNTKYDQFTTFEYGRGYQIYITGSTNVNLTVTGALPQTSSLQLKSGYNLIFCPKTQETNVEDALKGLSLGIDYSKVVHYNKQLSLFEKYDSSVQEFTSFLPGESYYIYCLKDVTWAITNSNPTTTFVYDGDGGRVKKTIGSSTTTYIGALYEVESDGTTRKHIFSGANRICAVESTGSQYFYHSDHLGSSNVITDGSGQQVGLTEFTPYGSTFKSQGTYDPKHKFTGKELDSTTGLYFYGRRYYDPSIGRWITADPTVQKIYDPQDLNRYAYCRNNPINLTDPTGLGWKSFWKKVENFFKKEVLPAVITAAAAVASFGILAAVTPMVMTFSTAMVIGASAAATTATLNTGEGRQIIQRVGSEFFDDVLGMRPSTAQTWGAIATYMVVNAGYQSAFGSIITGGEKVKSYDYEFGKDKALDVEVAKILKQGKGFNYGGVPKDPMQVSRVIYNKSRELVGVASKSSILMLGQQHTGIVMSDIPSLAESAKLIGIPGVDMYGLWGISHQATNVSLLEAGYGSTVMSIGGGWTTAVSTVVYGPYGGGAAGAAVASQELGK